MAKGFRISPSGLFEEPWQGPYLKPQSSGYQPRPQLLSLSCYSRSAASLVSHFDAQILLCSYFPLKLLDGIDLLQKLKKFPILVYQRLLCIWNLLCSHRFVQCTQRYIALLHSRSVLQTACSCLTVVTALYLGPLQVQPLCQVQPGQQPQGSLRP